VPHTIEHLSKLLSLHVNHRALSSVTSSLSNPPPQHVVPHFKRLLQRALRGSIPFIRAFGGIVGDKERKKDNHLQKAVTLQVPRDAAEAFFAERARLREANGGRRRKKNPKPCENNDDEEVGDDSEENED
jgi:hypothetical protein